MQEDQEKYFPPANQMFARIPAASTRSSMCGNSDDGVPTPSSYSPSRHNAERDVGSRSVVGEDNVNRVVDREAMELFSKTRQQNEEILLLRKQIADAGLKEFELQNEKYTLEKKVSELRKGLDDNQNKSIASASNQLALRKGDLDENMKLIHELKTVEDERYIFTSSMLRLLAEYEIRPHVINASSISDGIKRLYDQLQWKIRTSHASIVDINSMQGSQTGDRPFNKEDQTSGVSKGHFLETSTVPNFFPPYNHYGNERPSDHTSDMLRSQADHDSMNIKDPMREFASKMERGVEGFPQRTSLGERFENPNGERTDSQIFVPMDENASYFSEAMRLRFNPRKI